MRGALPATRQRLITSGNADDTRATGRRPLDEGHVSGAGASQASYETYRVRGDLATALPFWSDIPREVDGIRQLKVRTYILFAFNDSDAEITRAEHPGPGPRSRSDAVRVHPFAGTVDQVDSRPLPGWPPEVAAVRPCGRLP